MSPSTFSISLHLIHIRSDGDLPTLWGMCPLPFPSGREEVRGSIMPTSQETQSTKIKTHRRLECLRGVWGGEGGHHSLGLDDLE